MVARCTYHRHFWADMRERVSVRECVRVRKSVLERERECVHMCARERVEPMLDKV